VARGQSDQGTKWPGDKVTRGQSERGQSDRGQSDQGTKWPGQSDRGQSVRGQSVRIPQIIEPSRAYLTTLIAHGPLKLRTKHGGDNSRSLWRNGFQAKYFSRIVQRGRKIMHTQKILAQLPIPVRTNEKNNSSYIPALNKCTLDVFWDYSWTSEAKDKAQRWQLQKSMKEWFPSKMFFQDTKRT
jgi:hypothetical protein